MYFQDLVDTKGEAFSSKDLPRQNPSRFAISYVKKTKGDEYLQTHSFDPVSGSATKKRVADEGYVKDLKSKFEYYYNASI